MLMRFAIQSFLDDRELKNAQPVTIRGYKAVLDEFNKYLAEQEIFDTSGVNKAVVKSYFVMCMKERGNNPSTLNHKLTAVRAFFNYLQRDLDIYDEKSNPIRDMHRFKTDVRIDVFTDQHIRQILRYFMSIKYKDKTIYAYRDVAMVWFMLGTGARVQELVRLRWQDISFDYMTISLLGKNRTAMTIPMTEKLASEMVEYRTFVNHWFKGEMPEYVFVTNQGTPISDNGIKLVFKRAKTILNFSDVRLSAHTFRHTFAHRCLMSGMDIYTLQKMMRHSDLTMMQRYLALWGTALKELNDKHNPLNTMDL